VTSLFFLLLFS